MRTDSFRELFERIEEGRKVGCQERGGFNAIYYYFVNDTTFVARNKRKIKVTKFCFFLSIQLHVHISILLIADDES